MSERPVFSPALCRAARGLLSWPIDQLAEASKVPEDALRLFEAERKPLHPAAVVAIGAAFNAAGVITLQATKAGPGIRFLSANTAAETSRGLQAAWVAANLPGNLVSPIPSNAPQPFAPLSDLGSPAAVFPYRAADGQALFCTALFQDSEGRTLGVFPYTLWGGHNGALSWCMHAYPAPRPLFGLDKLARAEDRRILLVAGEMRAEEFTRRCPDLVVLTWSGGRKGIALADWSPLAGREVLLGAGIQDEGRLPMAAQLRRRLTEAGARLVDLPGDERRSPA